MLKSEQNIPGRNIGHSNNKRNECTTAQGIRIHDRHAVPTEIFSEHTKRVTYERYVTKEKKRKGLIRHDRTKETSVLVCGQR